MRLGIDFDGTIADTGNMKSAWIKENLGKDVEPFNTDRTDCVPLIGEKDYVRMGNEVYQRELTLRTKPNPGAIKVIMGLSLYNKLYLVTARPPERMEYAKEWLHNYLALRCFSGFESVRANNIVRSKSSICNELSLDMLVDDDIRHLNEIASPDVKRILIKTDSKTTEDSNGIVVIRNWNDILKYVN